MAVTLAELAGLCRGGGLRHHLDAEEGVIRVVFVTSDYRNAREERLAIMRIELLEHGTRCRVSLERAFATGRDVAASCLAICEATSDVPFVRLEHDATSRSLRLVAELAVEDAKLTTRQLFALVDSVVDAAERGQRSRAAATHGRAPRGFEAA